MASYQLLCCVIICQHWWCQMLHHIIHLSFLWNSFRHSQEVSYNRQIENLCRLCFPDMILNSWCAFHDTLPLWLKWLTLVWTLPNAWGTTQVICPGPEGRPGMSDVSPLSGISGLSFDSTLLSSLLFFCLVLLLFLSYLFSACWSILLNFFQKILPIFFVKTYAFLYGSCLAARRSKLVGGMCSTLP